MFSFSESSSTPTLEMKCFSLHQKLFLALSRMIISYLLRDARLKDTQSVDESSHENWKLFPS